MNRSYILLACALVLAALVCGWWLLDRGQNAAIERGAPEAAAVSAGDQTPGKSVRLSRVDLPEQGYVVVHADVNNAPGPVLGQSELLYPGEYADLTIPLSRQAQAGETLYILLYAHEGSGAFDPARDAPIQNGIGDPVFAQLQVAAQ
jgi:hypothetical protein